MTKNDLYIIITTLETQIRLTEGLAMTAETNARTAESRRDRLYGTFRSIQSALAGPITSEQERVLLAREAECLNDIDECTKEMDRSFDEMDAHDDMVADLRQAKEAAEVQLAAMPEEHNADEIDLVSIFG